jgi:hypothetical protein
MNICKNPDCNKRLPDGLNYCNEDCLKKHMEIKEASFRKGFPESAKMLENDAKKKEEIGTTIDNKFTHTNAKQHKEEYPRRNGKNTEQTVNIGTENKNLLQEQALRFMKTYPKDKTAKDYACLLCWDIRVSQRTAMENYIEPMIKHGILVPSGNSQFRLSPEYE